MQITNIEEVPWKIEWFSSKGFWQDANNQRNFLERVARKYNVKTIKDWKKINWQKVPEKGAILALLRQFDSMIAAVQFHFPGIFFILLTWRQ